MLEIEGVPHTGCKYSAGHGGFVLLPCARVAIRSGVKPDLMAIFHFGGAVELGKVPKILLIETRYNTIYMEDA